MSKKVTDKTKVALINDVCKHVSNNTDSWRDGSLGVDLAYLLWAIADDGVVGMFPDLPYMREFRFTLKADKKLWSRVRKYFVWM